MRNLTLFLFFISIFFGCKEKEKYPFKVEDFKSEHQSNLIRINYFSIDRNPLLYPFYPDSFSKAELIKLFNCNNPYIRINAFFALVERKDSSIYPLLINHLDDTSKIKWWAFDILNNDYLSDILVNETFDRLSTEDKKRIENEIVTHHAYLKSTDWITKRKPRK